MKKQTNIILILIVFLISVLIQYNSFRVSNLNNTTKEKIKKVARAGKPLLIKINSYPSAGKTTFIKNHNYNYKNFKLIDFDDFKPQATSDTLIEQSKKHPKDKIVLFGWPDRLLSTESLMRKDRDDVIYITVIPSFFQIVHNMIWRMIDVTRWHANGFWSPLTIYKQYSILRTQEDNQVFNTFDTSIDNIYKEYLKQIPIPLHFNILNRFFDKIYCISVPERKERMKNIFKTWELNVEFYDAYLIKDMNKDKLIKEGFLHPDCNLKDGEICCAYSHHQVHKKFINSSHENVLIFEDDLHKGPSNVKEFNEFIFPFIDNIPQDWESLNLGPCWESCDDNISNNYYQKSIDPVCWQSIAFTRNAMKQVIDIATPLNKEPCDVQPIHLIKSGKIISYSSKEVLFPQDKQSNKSLLEHNNVSLRCNNTDPVDTIISAVRSF